MNKINKKVKYLLGTLLVGVLSFCVLAFGFSGDVRTYNAAQYTNSSGTAYSPAIQTVDISNYYHSEIWITHLYASGYNTGTITTVVTPRWCIISKACVTGTPLTLTGQTGVVMATYTNTGILFNPLITTTGTAGANVGVRVDVKRYNSSQ